MRFLLIAVIISIVINCNAQKINIGQKVPDAVLAHLFNYKKDHANLISDFGGKPMIIDFWFTHCAACIQNIPVLDSLKKQFSSRLNILLCSFEPEDKVRKFFINKQSFKTISLPSVVSDTILESMFPHQSSPHEVWIDKNGIVQAITEAKYVTKENVALFVRGKLINLPLKEEPGMDIYMGELPYFQIEHDYNHIGNTIQYSFLCGYEPHMHGMTAAASPYEPIPGCLRIHASNLMLSSLYQLAYYNTTMHKSQLITEENDSLKQLLYDTAKKSLFCYDLITSGPELKVYRDMQQDLDRHFGIKSFYATKKMKCFVLSRTSSTSGRFIATGGVGMIDKIGLEFILKDIPMEAITYQNFYIDLPMPLVDETGYHGCATITYPTKFSDLQSFNKYLLKYDLVIHEEERFLDVIYLIKK